MPADVTLVERLRDVGGASFIEESAQSIALTLPTRARAVLDNLRTRVPGPRLLDALAQARGLSRIDASALETSLVTAARRHRARRKIDGDRRRFRAPRPPTLDPPAPSDVAEFAARHGVTALLGEKAREKLASFLRPGQRAEMVAAAPELTVEDALRGQWKVSARPAGWLVDEVRKAAAAFVADETIGKRLAAERRAGWERPPKSPGLGRLQKALRERHESLPSRSQRALLDTYDVWLDDESSSLLAGTSEAAQARPRGALRLAGFGEGNVHFECADEAWDGSALERFVIEVALDAIADREHPLHDELEKLASVPAWQRLLDRLATFAVERTPDGTAGDERLVFRVTSAGASGWRITPIQKRREDDGSWGRGTELVPAQLGTITDIPGRDRDVLDALRLVGWRGSASPMRGAGRVLSILAGHPAVVDEEGVSLRVERASFSFVAVDEDEGVRIGARIGGETVFGEALAELHDGEAHVIVKDDDARLIVVAPADRAALALAEALAAFPTAIPPAAAGELLPSILGSLAERVPLEWPRSLRGDEVPVEEGFRLRIDLEGARRDVALDLVPLAGGPRVQPGAGEPVQVAALPGGVRVHCIRDRSLEVERARSLSSSLGLRNEDERAPFSWTLPGDEAVLELLARAKDEIGRVTVEWPSERRVAVRGRIEGTSLRVSVRSAEGWIGLSGTALVDGEVMTLAALLHAARSGRRFVELSPGHFFAIERSLREQLLSLASVGTVEGDEVKIARFAAPIAMDLLGSVDSVERDAGFAALEARIVAAAASEVPLPAGLNATLRDYQEAGFRWLTRLASWDAGAVLADDMGLGKTVQALALLLHRAALGPALVVAPTSVGPGWLKEAGRFAPSLRSISYRGEGRAALLAGLGPGDLVVTSYDLAARDGAILGEHNFATLVLDEAQWLKNAATRRVRTIRGLRADLRIALTGTPLENHLGELWSLFSLVAPGLLGSASAFRDRFARPIERDGDPERRAALARVLRPFLLRRRKDEVAPELPAKTEVLRPVELGVEERRLYEAERHLALGALATDGGGKKGAGGDGRFAVLAAISRLRQLACHPRLVHADSAVPSSKLTSLLSLLEEIEAVNGRVLVFSEWTRLLALVREALDRRRVPYLELDGQTPSAERTRRIDRWQAGEGRVFLLSLKAGGTGLNLTGADWVVHLDPWWNPAVEDQATDRAHRIGQTKPVTVVRIVAQSTIEEAVLGLHDHKRALAAGVLEGADVAGTLSVSELVDLVRSGAETAAPDDELDGEDESRAAE